MARVGKACLCAGTQPAIWRPQGGGTKRNFIGTILVHAEAHEPCPRQESGSCAVIKTQFRAR
jgi:hypothetical protein